MLPLGPAGPDPPSAAAMATAMRGATMFCISVTQFVCGAHLGVRQVANFEKRVFDSPQRLEVRAAFVFAALVVACGTPRFSPAISLNSWLQSFILHTTRIALACELHVRVFTR
jgi:hypothetical protein